MTSFQVYYTFQAILSISKMSARARPRARPRARFFACSTYGMWKRRFFTCFGFLIVLSTIVTNFQSFSTYNNVIRAR